MAVITIHPKNKEEVTLFEYLAKRLNTPYVISQDKPVTVKKETLRLFRFN